MLMAVGYADEGQRIVIAGVLHHGLTVSNLESSIEWYTRNLGLVLVHRQRGDNDYTRNLVGVDDAVIEVAQLAIADQPSPSSTHIVELIEYVKGADAGAALYPVNSPGATHLAFVVTNIHEMYESMTQDGVHFVNPPVSITEGANVGGFACYLRDPDGISIELLQYGSEKAVAMGLVSGESQ